MSKTGLLTAVAFLALCRFADGLPSAPQQQLGDLLVVASNVQSTKTDGRYRARPGFHYVRVIVTVRNVGSKAVCTFLSATLDSSLGGGRKWGHVRLNAKNKIETVRGDSINQMLPGEEAEGYIIFGNLRDGLEPISLTIDSQGQSCETGLSDVKPITFHITHTKSGVTIAQIQSTEPEGPAQPEPRPVKPSPTTRTTAPKATYAPDAEYTDAAREARFNGVAKFRVTVGSDGLLHNIEPLNHLGMGLDEQALAALGKWRFEPATRDGKPVALTIDLDFNFKLY